MAQATVFVDDAVRGRLPQVCAKTGVPTADQIRVRSGVGDPAGFGVAWLLLLAGPLGWIGLLLMAVLRDTRREELEVLVPLDEPAYRTLRVARRRERIGTWLVFGTVALGFLLLLSATRSDVLSRFAVGAVAVAFVGGVALCVAGSLQHRAARVTVDLDASRRWVRLGQVHPAFAAACQQAERDRDRV